MSISLLRFRGNLITTLPADLSDAAALVFQQRVTRELAATGFRGLVIDIGTVDIVDSFMARVINDTASMARLIGAEVVVCGVQPAVAITLVEMGRNLIGVETTFTLDQAVDRVEARKASRGDALIDPPIWHA